jgi:hypothetical protein
VDLPGPAARTWGYLTEWLAAQAASGYAEYDAESGKFHPVSPAFGPDSLALHISSGATPPTLPRHSALRHLGMGVGP